MAGRWRRRIALMLLALLLASIGLGGVKAQGRPHVVYLPQVNQPRKPSIFSFETWPGSLGDGRVRARAEELGVGWVRLNGVEWNKIQPERGGPYDWSSLALLDSDIAAAQALGITPVVIIRGAPSWAAVAPSNCAAVKDENLDDYRAFIEAVAARYLGRVAYWEFGNEPDVDPRLVGPDSPFGCVGDIDDPYYGGERYGRMLRAVAPALRRASPGARIVLGGLLLDRPETTNPSMGQPERFFEGVLRAGASDSFDIVAYHSYPSFSSAGFDHDLQPNGPWASRGGWALGKAQFLREVMARHGVSKPLWLNEVSLICTPPWAQCGPPTSEFFAAQSAHVARVMARAAASGIEQISWYTLNGSGWRSSGLLDDNQSPRPVFRAYQQFIRAVSGYTKVLSVDYGPQLEAYRFVKNLSVVDVVWSRTTATQSASLPAASFLSAVGSEGASLSVRLREGSAQVDVGFAAVFIERLP